LNSGLTYKWSPDGEDVAILINDGRLYIWNLQNNNLRLIYKIENIESYWKIMEWSPNGKRLAIGYSRGNHDYNEEEIGNILLLDLPTNVIIMNLEFETLIRDIGFSLDSSKMAIAKRDGTTLIINNS
jgi:WD40 repeat protein